MIGAIMMGLSLAQGAYGAYQGNKSAHEQKAMARMRARDLTHQARKRFNFNIGETFYNYRDDLNKSYDMTASNIFKITNQYQGEVDKIKMNNQAQTMNNVLSSSYGMDATNQLDNELSYQANLQIYDENLKNESLAHSYATNVIQLGLNREKMEKDIQGSVATANAQARQSQAQGIAQGMQGLSSAFSTYQNWVKK